MNSWLRNTSQAVLTQLNSTLTRNTQDKLLTNKYFIRNTLYCSIKQKYSSELNIKLNRPYFFILFSCKNKTATEYLLHLGPVLSFPCQRIESSILSQRLSSRSGLEYSYPSSLMDVLDWFKWIKKFKANQFRIITPKSRHGNSDKDIS